MNELILKSIEDDLNPIIKQIIFDLRPEKKINKELFEELYTKLAEYKDHIKGEEFFRRSFAGKLFYLFSTMVVEAKHANYDSKIMNEIFQLRIYLFDVFDEDMMN